MKGKSTRDLFIITVTVDLTIILGYELVTNQSNYISEVLKNIKLILWLMLFVDLTCKLIVSRRPLRFLSIHKADIIALIPALIYEYMLLTLTFNNMLEKEIIYKLAMALWFAALILKLRNEIKIVSFKNNLIYMVILTIAIIVVGAIFISIIEGMSVGDALWWSFVTFTTVGYGDIVLKTTLGRIIAVIMMILGIGFIGITTSTLAAYIFNGKRVKDKDINSQILQLIKDKVDKFQSLSDNEIDEIAKVLKALKNKENN